MLTSTVRARESLNPAAAGRLGEEPGSRAPAAGVGVTVRGHHPKRWYPGKGQRGNRLALLEISMLKIVEAGDKFSSRSLPESLASLTSLPPCFSCNVSASGALKKRWL